MLNNSNKKPIIHIEDDPDDQLIIRQALTELSIANPIRFFPNGQEALDYLQTTSEQPLLILCDINMPMMSGLELRNRIDANAYLKAKAVPFIFYTTSASPELVKKAYEGSIQGFHQKEPSFTALQRQLDQIITYWKSCLHPNSFQGY